MAVFGLTGIRPAAAATITVTTTTDEYSDPGPGTGCSLREAIRAASSDVAFGGCPAGSGGDTIVLPAGTYLLAIGGANENLTAEGDLDIFNDPLTIQGAAAATTVIDGSGMPGGDRVLHVMSEASLFDLTITGGVNNDSFASGGGVLNTGTASFVRTIVSGNSSVGTTSSFGGGLYNSDGTLTVAESTIADNTAGPTSGGSLGGGVYTTTAGVVTIVRSSIIGNTAAASGGGSSAQGGGVHNAGDMVTLENTTVSGNVVSAATTARGGGVSNEGDNTNVLLNTTVTGNTATGGTPAGGGLRNQGTTTLTNTIVAGNTANGSPDCAGGATSGGHNIVGDDTGCAFTPGTGDKPDTDPLLGSLADN
ncbi:MAG: CSLREA domain-containing protein, partial [Actinomycetota bacterium]